MKKFIEKYEILKCKFCYQEYENLNLKKCPNCDGELEIKTRYRIKLKAKILLVIIIICLASGIYGFNYYQDIKECYNAVEGGYWDTFQRIIDKHPIIKETFSNSAYKQLYKFMDKEIEKLKNGQETDEIFELEKNISWTQVSDLEEEKIKEKITLAEAYKTINNSNKLINENNYVEAYAELQRFVKQNKEKYQEITEIVTGKQKEIQETAINEAMLQAQNQMNQNNYEEVQSILSSFLDTKNEQLVSLYNESVNAELEQEEKERQAMIQKERQDYEIYCYFNLIVWNEKLTSDDVAFSKCANKFGISKEEAELAYNTVDTRGGWYYQDTYPDIFEKYASQYK